MLECEMDGFSDADREWNDPGLNSNWIVAYGTHLVVIIQRNASVQTQLEIPPNQLRFYIPSLRVRNLPARLRETSKGSEEERRQTWVD